MIRVLAIAAGGAAGAVFRYWMSIGVHALAGRGFPYGTLAVNVLGSLLMGYLFVQFIDRLAVSAEWRAAVLIGLLGAFTTFSTFTVETLNLVEGGAWLKAAVNILASVGLCLIAAGLGMWLGRQGAG